MAVTLANVAGDGSTVTTADGQTVPIEDSARKFVRAAVHERLLAGAGPDEPLLTTPGGAHPRPRWVAAQASAARATFGLPLASGAISGKTTTGGRWASRWGLTLMDLT